eukprot:TRINITY_DN2317_c0_g1_i1.p2 TRINITY_DN2317_c0_g1~~TRINITY_DN2317_c0_g1_i1.p2  ORF type:complete len:232 (+),score=81.06 TRINITY_DN2317_c0_g1_i1:61-756(+)
MLLRGTLRAARRGAACGRRHYRATEGFLTPDQAMAHLEIEPPLTQEKLDAALEKALATRTRGMSFDTVGSADMSDEYKARVAYALLSEVLTGRRMDQQELASKVQHAQETSPSTTKNLFEEMFMQLNLAFLWGVTGTMAAFCVLCWTCWDSHFSTAGFLSVHGKKHIGMYGLRVVDDKAGERHGGGWAGAAPLPPPPRGGEPAPVHEIDGAHVQQNLAAMLAAPPSGAVSA